MLVLLPVSNAPCLLADGRAGEQLWQADTILAEWPPANIPDGNVPYLLSLEESVSILVGFQTWQMAPDLLIPTVMPLASC